MTEMYIAQLRRTIGRIKNNKNKRMKICIHIKGLLRKRNN